MDKRYKKKRPPGRPKGSTKSTDDIQLQVNFSQLDPIDRAMLTIIGSDPAIKNSKLASKMNLGIKQTTKRRNRGLFQIAIIKLQMPAIKKCQEAQKEAADTLIDLLKSDDEKIRLAAAQTLLKPVIPHTAIIKHETGADITINNMSKEELEKFIKEGLNGLNQMDIIEGEIIESDDND